jgi:hypothetical protein
MGRPRLRRKEEAVASRKRISIATLFGLLSGIVCYLLGKYWLGIDITLSSFFTILAHRTLLGVVLGISALKWHWALHGILIGLIVGIPDYHFNGMIGGDVNCGLYFFGGAAYGLLIEFFTSIVFKAKVVDR